MGKERGSRGQCTALVAEITLSQAHKMGSLAHYCVIARHQ